MTRFTLPLVLAASLSLLAAGCDESASDGGVLDDESSSFGIGKADEAAGGFQVCELRESLEIVNESTSSAELLNRDVGIHKRAAEQIVLHRIGPDGKQGTADDDLYDDLKELDDVPWVGPRALEALATYVAVRCKEELAGRPFVSAKTFDGSTGGGWTRDSVELEATMTMTGTTGQRLRALLTEQDDRGRTGFEQIRRSKTMQAFSYGFPLDEIPWNSDGHNARESMPFVAWTIERDRFGYEDGTGERELSLGTDKMDDTYYDTVNFDLLEENMVLRGRVRWDSDTEVRRLLIAAKLDGAVDEDGLKRAAKIDVRTEGGRHKDTLDNDVRSGTVPWGFGGTTAIEPVRIVWQTLKDAGRLLQTGGETDVLLLDPKVHIKSQRSRYHLDFARTSDVTKVYTNGKARVAQMVERAKAALAGSQVEQGDVAEVEALIALGEAIADDSAVLDEARDAIAQVDPALADVVYVDGFLANAPRDWDTLEKRRLIAEATQAVFARFASLVDDVDRTLTGTRGLDGDDYVDWYIDWQKAIDDGLRKRTITQPFLAGWRAADSDDALRADTIKAFNTFGEAAKADGTKGFDDFEAIDVDNWANLGKHLEYEYFKITKRMIEAGGTVAQALYWEVAREYFVPASSRASGNFIIDTIDFTEMVTEEEWTRLDDVLKTPAGVLPGDVVFHSTLVNEVQLELTEVKEYIERIETLTQELAAKPGDAEIQRNLDGAKFVFDVLQDSIKRIAELKEEDLLDGLDDLGAPDTMEWEPAQHSKGKTALLLLTDKL